MMKYNSYRDSEIDWLGEIPASWKIDRIKNIGSVNGRVGWKALKASEYVNSGFFFLSTPNIKDVEIDFENVNYITAERYYESPEIMLKVGDILLVKDGSTLGIVNVVRHLPDKGTVNSSIAVLRIKQFHSIYGYYFLLSNYIQNVIQLKKDGMGVPHLFQKDINNFEIIIPSFEEQTAIAEYLDTKTQAIDKKVSLLEKKIGYYQELRKSLINETVTMGLDKNVKLKDSGIDWIGKIPEHWEVKRIKDYTYIKARIGWQGLRSDEFEQTGDYYCVTGTDFQNGQIDWSNCYHVEKERFEQDKKIIIREGDLLITKDGSIGKIAIVQSLPKPATLNSGVFVTRPKLGKYLNKYMYWILNSSVFLDFIDLNKNGTTILHLYQNVFENFFYCLPPIKEQIEIADYLLEKTSKIDQIITNIQTQITTLKELRKTLINDVVTGKIKVLQD